MIKLFINEQHSLLEDQKRELERFVSERKHKVGEVETVLIPAEGWTLEEMDKIVSGLWNEYMNSKPSEEMAIIFVSPVPYLIKELSSYTSYSLFSTWVFHNDKRDKRELDNGKVIYTVAKEGWKIV